MYDRLPAHIEKQRLAETEIYILDPMTAQLTHETRLKSIALSTESYLQRSSFDSVHFLEFYFFFFATRYGMVEFLFFLFRR